MKRFALTLVAASVVAGGAVAPVLADDGFETYQDTTVLSVDRDNGVMRLSNGTTLDQSIEWFAMPQASAGDKVRVMIDHNNELDRVVVLR